mmetsp:Transcript_27859/g.88683  ORF Transcript_27859/g.88683 Transcript_27859/m.88683 type:complete len:241 (+) Transcript_27859:913-1635(+)
MARPGARWPGALASSGGPPPRARAFAPFWWTTTCTSTPPGSPSCSRARSASRRRGRLTTWTRPRGSPTAGRFRAWPPSCVSTPRWRSRCSARRRLRPPLRRRWPTSFGCTASARWATSWTCWRAGGPRRAWRRWSGRACREPSCLRGGRATRPRQRSILSRLRGRLEQQAARLRRWAGPPVSSRWALPPRTQRPAAWRKRRPLPRARWSLAARATRAPPFLFPSSSPATRTRFASTARRC